jgi:hypothetical protein
MATIGSGRTRNFGATTPWPRRRWLDTDGVMCSVAVTGVDVERAGDGRAEARIRRLEDQMLRALGKPGGR